VKVYTRGDGKTRQTRAHSAGDKQRGHRGERAPSGDNDDSRVKLLLYECKTTCVVASATILASSASVRLRGSVDRSATCSLLLHPVDDINGTAAPTG